MVSDSFHQSQELLEEAAIMAQFDSPFIVQLVGLVTLGSPVLMVIEFAEHGSLKSFLDKNETDEHLRLLWAGDIAEGMAHVHSKGFLHRDLATRNVLVGSDMRCKVSDFGLAREVDENDAYYRSRGGQVRWRGARGQERE
jgi:serine/threonine protein kinase